MTDIRSMTAAELTDVMTELGEKPFRARQLFEWLHRKQAAGYAEMKNLPAALRGKLESRYPLYTLEAVQELHSRRDGTQKYLFRLSDGHVIESVLMRYHHGNCVCISSQVGCRMGCRFCASTIGGRIRNLSAGEMLDQIYRITRLTGERVSHIVVMGTGEPLDNYDNLIRFLRLVSSPEGLNISQRNITVSTCGLVPAMDALAKENLKITLALSLHAPNDEKRRELMPIARQYAIDEVLAACGRYFAATGRRITLEYALVKGQNDSAGDAAQLAGRIRPLGCHVNLIPVNPVRESALSRPDRKAVEQFQKRLCDLGVNATIRRELGSDIDGACGQLRRRYQQEQKESDV